MKRNFTNSISRWTIAVGMGGLVAALPLTLGGCNTKTEKNTTTTQKVKETPEGTKVTTEKTETKTETTPKNPNP